MSKTVIIVGASQGWGHMKAAFNIASELNLHTDLNVEITDALDYLPVPLKYISDHVWRFASRYCHPLYSYVYRRLVNSSSGEALQSRRKVLANSNVLEILLGRLLRKFIKKLDEINPVVYVATHPIAAAIGSYLKDRFGYKFCIVSTDFIIHSAHIPLNADAFFVPPQFQLKATEQRLKIFKERFKKTGIPIDSKFAEKKSQDQIKRKLGLSCKRTTILFSFGGDGLKATRHISVFKKLLNSELSFQLIVLAGYNTRFANKLRRRYGDDKRLKIYGYLDDVTDLFAASDLFIGKGGGLSISEAIAMKLPMLFIDKMPGQEEYNIDLIMTLGLGRYVEEDSLVATIKEYTKRRYKPTRAPFDTIARPHSSSDIARGIATMTL